MVAIPVDNFGTVVGENPDCLLLSGTVFGENPDHVCWDDIHVVGIDPLFCVHVGPDLWFQAQGDRAQRICIGYK